MELAVKAWVFNPSLRGYFVIVSGRNEEGAEVYASGTVDRVIGDKIEVREATQNKEVKLHNYYLHEFTTDGLTLEVFDQSPTKCEPNHNPEVAELLQQA